jgi:hypothetical protein
MPGGMTFVADEATVQIFPEKLFYFTDGKRDIFIKGLKEGNITISVKVGGTTIKRLPIKVYKDGQVIYPKEAMIIANKAPVIGEVNNGIIVFKDNSGKSLYNLKYGSSYKINTNNGTKICMKSGNINNLNAIVKKSCDDNDFVTSKTFTYNDTVG